MILYSGLIIFGALHHEPWRDEAQTWLVARDLSISDMVRNAPYEGSPVLWHLLVSPLAKFGIAYGSQAVLHLIIAILAVAIFLFSSPFSGPFKAAFTFSFFMAFEYAVVARSYALSVFLLFLAASLDQEKTDKPITYGIIIFCLFNTNVISFGPAIALSGLFLFEALQKRSRSMNNYAGFLLMVLGGVCALFQLLLPADSWKITYLGQAHWQAAFEAFGDAFFPASVLLPAFPHIIAYLIFFAGLLGIIRHSKSLLYFTVSSLWLLYIFIFVYSGNLRHHGFLIIHLIVALWIGWARESGRNKRELLQRIASGALLVALFVSIPLTLKNYVDEYRYAFSGSREMAMFIKANGYEARPIIAHRPTIATSLLPYLPGKQFWYADRESYGTYYKFDRHWKEQFSLSKEEVLRRAEKVFPKLSGTALLLSYELDPSLLKLYDLRLVHRTTEEVFGYGGERYWLYMPNTGRLDGG